MNRDQPRNFAGNYPLGGERVGPAWRAAWEVLADRSSTYRPWVRSNVLAEVMCTAGPIEDKTARNLLGKARRAGVVKVRYGGPHGEASYRLRDAPPR